MLPQISDPIIIIEPAAVYHKPLKEKLPHVNNNLYRGISQEFKDNNNDLGSALNML